MIIQKSDGTIHRIFTPMVDGHPNGIDVPRWWWSKTTSNGSHPWETLQQGTSNNCHRSLGAPNLPANDSALFSFRFSAVHPKDVRDSQLRQLFEVPNNRSRSCKERLPIHAADAAGGVVMQVDRRPGCWWPSARTSSVKIQRGELLKEEALLAAHLLQSAEIELLSTWSLFDAATRISIEIDHPAYDCLYLFLAVEKKCQFVTADRHFVPKQNQGPTTHASWQSDFDGRSRATINKYVLV
jgi:hypothetical protein